MRLRLIADPADVAQPAFQRTSTAPVSFNTPSFGSSSSSTAFGLGAGNGFQTTHEIMQEAKGIVNKEAWRRSTRELQPYGSGSDLGTESDADTDTAAGGGGVGGSNVNQGAGKVAWDRGMKRTNQPDDEDEEGTEVDEDETAPTMDDTSAVNHYHQPQAGAGQDEFPPVFQSPNLTQPELFHRPNFPSQQHQRNTNQPQPQTGRLTRGLPARSGRTLGKTVSAPVGSLWGGGDVDMDTEGQGEDGFDIAEWAKEEF